HVAVANTAFVAGEFLAASEQWAKATGIFDSTPPEEIARDADPRLAWPFMGWALWCLGYPDQARERVRETVALARDLGDPYCLAFAVFTAASVFGNVGDSRTALEYAEAAVEAAGRYSSTYQSARAQFIRGAS